MDNWYSLDKNERHRITKLGNEAVVALLPRIKKESWNVLRDEARERKNLPSNGAYFHFRSLVNALDTVFTPRHTQEVIDLYEGISRYRGRQRDWMDMILPILENKGDESLVIPFLLKHLAGKQPNNSLYFSERLLQSQHPSAVEYVFSLIRDPKTTAYIREIIYMHIAGTGGEEGRKLFLSSADHERGIPSMAEVMKLSLLTKEVSGGSTRGTRLLASRTATNGVLWGLVVSDILGSDGDLWIVHHDGEHWIDPIFTGADLSERPSRKNKRVATYQGLTLKQLVDGAWFETFVGNSEILRDTDADGLKDLVEERIGTNLNNADTDGDGVSDLSDKNPLAAPRMLSEDEQVLATAFEARFRFEGDRTVPCVVNLPKGIRPIELMGWKWFVLAKPHGSTKGKLDPLYGKGVGFVTFTAPSYNFHRSKRSKSRTRFSDRPILWNRDHTEAKVGISSYYGGLDGSGVDVTLRKINGRWYVVGMYTAYVS